MNRRDLGGHFERLRKQAVSDPLHVPSNRYFERIEGLFEAVVASGIERLPADRRYARRQQSLRDGITVSDRDWAILQELRP